VVDLVCRHKKFKVTFQGKAAAIFDSNKAMLALKTFARILDFFMKKISTQKGLLDMYSILLFFILRYFIISMTNPSTDFFVVSLFYVFKLVRSAEV